MNSFLFLTLAILLSAVYGCDRSLRCGFSFVPPEGVVSNYRKFDKCEHDPNYASECSEFCSKDYWCPPAFTATKTTKITKSEFYPDVLQHKSKSVVIDYDFTGFDDSSCESECEKNWAGHDCDMEKCKEKRICLEECIMDGAPCNDDNGQLIGGKCCLDFDNIVQRRYGGRNEYRACCKHGVDEDGKYCLQDPNCGNGLVAGQCTCQKESFGGNKVYELCLDGERCNLRRDGCQSAQEDRETEFASLLDILMERLS